MTEVQPSRPFRRPFRLIDHEESFEVIDAAGTALAFLYFEDDPRRRSTMKRMTREDARRLAVQIVRLPETLEELKQLRAAGDEPA
jgi:hypothetical protein